MKKKQTKQTVLQISILDKKIEALHKQYDETAKKKQIIIQQLKAINTYISELNGSYQSVMELKEELEPKKKT